MIDSNKKSLLSAHIFLVAFLAVLVIAAPFRLAAQQTPAPANQTAAEQADAKADATGSQDDQNKAFLLESPLVKWTSSKLHLPVTVAAGIFEFINFAIIVLCIGIPLVRWMPKFLRNRGEKVRTDIEAARKVTADANSRLSAVEAKLASIGEEIQKFRAEVERECAEDEARIKAGIKEESERIVASAEQEIAVATAQAKRGLRNFAADLAIDQAGKNLALTPETDQALIAEFISSAAQGRQN